MAKAKTTTPVMESESEWIEVFRTGDHTSSNGSKGSYSKDDIKELTEAVNSSVSEGAHRVPLVLGHPKDNEPAYGWGAKLKNDGKSLFAKFKDVSKDLKDAVDQKQYQSVSVRIYPRNHPNNPTPGKLNLGHIGFFGAVQPAIKGMRPIELSEFSEHDSADGLETYLFQEQDYTDYFSFHVFSDISKAFKGIREKLIEYEDIETANSIVPSYLIDSINRYSTMAGFKIPELNTAQPLYKEDPMDLEEAKTLLESNGYNVATPEDTLQSRIVAHLMEFQEESEATDEQISSAIGIEVGDFMAMKKKSQSYMVDDKKLHAAAKLLGVSYADVKNMMSKDKEETPADHQESKFVTEDRMNDLLGEVAALSEQLTRYNKEIV